MAFDPVPAGRGTRAPGAALILLALVMALPAAAIEFRRALDDSPLAVPLPEGDQLTAAVARFHATGENPYEGDAEAIAAGKRLYARWCQACHLPDATGRIGPNLVDDLYKYPRTATDAGMFEVVYGGAAGAMQSFATRLSQDQILQVIAFVHSLRK
jgi:cytochrome c-L